MNLIIVSGLSGSGKSVALNTLADLGYDCVDNLPLDLLPVYVEHLTGADGDGSGQAAVGIDARNRPQALQAFPQYLERLRASEPDSRILFLQASDETLIKRFSETRRKHPLSHDDLPLTEAIAAERRLLEPVSDRADLRIDTSRTTLHQLRTLIRERIGHHPAGPLSILLQSFGFKYGIPGDADFVFDVRCLPNPYWVEALRPLTGRDAAVAGFLEGHEAVHEMHAMLKQFFDTWIPRFADTGRSYLTVAIGCTGGQHRSVYLAERLAGDFRDRYRHVLIQHRELP